MSSLKSFVVCRQEVPQKWAYCWISRNLCSVRGWVKAGNVSDINPHAHSLSNTHTHTSTFISSIIWTHPLLSVNLHCWCFVMMSPSLPLKVDAGGLSPQPDTPDTPVSPYLSSPDEVTATWGWWAGAVKLRPPPPHPTPSHLLPQVPSSLDWSAFGKFPLLLPMPAKSMISPSPFTSHDSTRAHINTIMSTINSHTFNLDCINQFHCETLKTFKDQSQWSLYLTYIWLITLTNH